MSPERLVVAGFLILVGLCVLCLAVDMHVRLTTAQMEACGRNPFMDFCQGWVSPR